MQAIYNYIQGTEVCVRHIMLERLWI